MKGIIIDGVASSGKTSILRHLHSKISEQYPSSTKFFISEHYTERMLEHLKEKGALTGTHIKEHMGSIIANLNNFQKMLDKSKFANNPKGADIFVTLERFILTHMASMDMGNQYSTQEAKHHFETLGKMGFKQVVLVIPKSVFKERLMSTLVHRNDAWREHLYSRGGEKEVVEYYVNWQENFLDHTKKFQDVIETLVIEVKDNNYIEYSNMIYNHCFN